MSDDPKENEIPAIRFAEKKVDDSWKEEMRREREAAAAKKAEAQKAAAPRPAESAEAPQTGDDATAPAAVESAKPEKPKGTPQEQQQTKIFMTFLAGLAQQALMQLGEMENPYSGQAELDLQGARYTVELLNTIAVKTKGNLTEEEAQSLGATIQDLRQRYVEIANEMQRQMAQKGGLGGPGGALPGPGSGRR